MGRGCEAGDGELPAGQSLDIREQYEKQLKDLQEAYGEAMLELRARKKLAALMEREDGN